MNKNRQVKDFKEFLTETLGGVYLTNGIVIHPDKLAQEFYENNSRYFIPQNHADHIRIVLYSYVQERVVNLTMGDDVIDSEEGKKFWNELVYLKKINEITDKVLAHYKKEGRFEKIAEVA